MKADNIISFLQYILGMFFNIAIVAVVGYAIFALTVRGFNFGQTFASEMMALGPDYEFQIVLDEETSATEISRYLEERGVLNASRRRLFDLELFLLGRLRTYQPGTYILNHNMSNTEIHHVMRRSPLARAPHETITVLEGWTIRDMADYFESRGFFTAEEFIYVAHYGHFNFSFLLGLPDRPNGLEGYLFPDTYQIPVNPAPGDIIVRMLRRFDEIFNDDLREQAYERGFTIDDVVIMASVIEMESRLAHERLMVSQLIHNRLAINMRLEMCSTVKYTMDDPPERLSIAQTQVDTPFNTYTRAGLPIGPITNPGAASLRAVLNPTPHDYLFFVLYNFDTGEHFFSRTHAEHQAADDRARARQ